MNFQILNQPCVPGILIDHDTLSFLYIVELNLLKFCWGFFIYIPKGYWSTIFFPGFGIRIMLASEHHNVMWHRLYELKPKIFAT